MKMFTREYETAQYYIENNLQDFPGFTPAQLEAIRNQSGRFYAWYKAHPHLHNCISLLTFAFIFSLDYLVLTRLPTHLPWILTPASTLKIKILAALIVGVTHGFVLYTLGVYTIHEGGAHNGIIQVTSGKLTGRITRALNFLANNASRLVLADPVFYKTHHISHHGKFATAQDGSFTNFVTPTRFYKSFLPYAYFLNYNDFRVHADTVWSRSRILSLFIGGAFMAFLWSLLVPRFGWVFALLTTAVINIHFAFLLDRLREGIEHNLMPLDRFNGTRNFGYGFWGMLIGGGPWGQGCHLSHHMAPTLPWYHQLMLHKTITRVLTPEQREVFLLKPVVGFPLLVLRIFRESARVSKDVAKVDSSEEIYLSPAARQAPLSHASLL
jgi:hypothetical protein